MKRRFRHIVAIVCLAFCMCFFSACEFPEWMGDPIQGSSSSGGSQSGQTSGGNQGGQTDGNQGGQTSGGGQGSTTPPATVTIPEGPFTVSVRTDAANITDSGRASQKMDVVFLSDYFDVKAAYSAGYTKLQVTIDFEAKEVDDGYQYVFLYSDTKCKGNSFFDKVVDEFYDPQDPSLLYEYRFEHGGTGKNTEWGAHSFSASLRMDRLKDDLYIRYGASGQGNDSWQNRNIVVTFRAVR